MAVDQPTTRRYRTDSPTLIRLREEANAAPFPPGGPWPTTAEPWMLGAAGFLREMADRREAIGAHGPMNWVDEYEMEEVGSPWTEEMIEVMVKVHTQHRRNEVDLLRRRAAWLERIVAEQTTADTSVPATTEEEVCQ